LNYTRERIHSTPLRIAQDKFFDFRFAIADLQSLEREQSLPRNHVVASFHIGVLCLIATE